MKPRATRSEKPIRLKVPVIIAGLESTDVAERNRDGLAKMKSRYFTRLAEGGKLPRSFSEQYSADPAHFFVKAAEVQRRFPDKKLGADIPWGAVGLNTYPEERIGEGLKQLMAGSGRFKLPLLGRDDIASLSDVAARVTGIEAFDRIAERTIPGMLENR